MCARLIIKNLYFVLFTGRLIAMDILLPKYFLHLIHDRPLSCPPAGKSIKSSQWGRVSSSRIYTAQPHGLWENTHQRTTFIWPGFLEWALGWLPAG
jgi:hypothetical protein